MTDKRRKSDYSIARLSLPAILSNITVPLLGLTDTTISGHLGSEVYIGAIAVGTMMMSALFWLFGFLRMGTTGMIAQAFGEMQIDAVRGRNHGNIIFCRAIILAVGGGVLLIALQCWLIPLLLWYIAPPAEVSVFATRYFSICIWAAPAILMTNVVNGWFLGMQDTVRPMVISISTAALNIVLSLLLVFQFKLGFIGVAIGTLTAGWIGLLLALILLWIYNGRRMPVARWRDVVARGGMARFFRINSDIFLRTLCIMAVTLSVTAYGARLGAMTLAANAIMMQFFVIFSYFMDGLAFAAEALSGRFAGERRPDLLRQAVLRLVGWSAVVALVFTAVYLLGYREITALITSDVEVVAEVCKYRIWLILIPLITVAAFIMDGIYIGLTATRRMLLSTFASTAIFFAVCLLPGLGSTNGVWWPNNNMLWIAFLSYLLARGIILAIMYPRLARSVFHDTDTCLK